MWICTGKMYDHYNSPQRSVTEMTPFLIKNVSIIGLFKNNYHFFQLIFQHSYYIKPHIFVTKCFDKIIFRVTLMINCKKLYLIYFTVK